MKIIALIVTTMLIYPLALLGTASEIVRTRPVEAQQSIRVISKAELALDTERIVIGEDFSRPNSILVTPITLPANTSIDHQDWYKGLFYYFSSSRFNFRDLPFHYVVDKNGRVYEGVAGGVERELLVEEASGKPIHIAYLSDRNDRDFTGTGGRAVENLALRLANENRIAPDNIEIASVELVKNEAEGIVNITAGEIFGSWRLGFAEILETIENNYSPVDRLYDLRITAVDVPEGKVEMGEIIEVGVEIENSSDYSIYGDDESNLILSSSRNGGSPFFVNNEWISTTELVLLDEDEIVRPGETVAVSFKVLAPLPGGDFSDSFQLSNGSGQEFDDQIVEIQLEVDRAGKRVLEIAPTETGALNVRENPTINSAAVGRVTPGQYFVWEQEQNGWYRIVYEERPAWVLGRYARVL